MFGADALKNEPAVYVEFVSVEVNVTLFPLLVTEVAPPERKFIVSPADIFSLGPLSA